MAFAALSTSTKPSAGVSGIKFAEASEAIAAGLAVRLNAAGKLEIANAAAAATASVDGVATSQAVAAGQVISYVPVGHLITTSGLTAGDSLWLGGGANEGEWGSTTDVNGASGYGTLIGVALSSTVAVIIGRALGVQI